MKRWMMTAIAMLAMAAISGCGGNTTVTQASEPTTVWVEETVPETEMISEVGECPLEDGIYSAKFKTDSSMFRINEACDGRGTLTVENGKMTIHVSLASVHIVNLYPGSAEDAKADEAGWLQPTSDTVTYKDGESEEVLGYDIPVPVLDQEFAVALIGTKGKWYDHTVTVSDVQPME